MDDMNKMDELNGADVFSDWAHLVNNKEPEGIQSGGSGFDLDDLMTENSDDHWLALFQKTNLLGMDLVALTLLPNYVHDFKYERDQFKIQQQSFLSELSQTHRDDLRVAGLSDNQIDALKEGVLPINWTVHLKYPVAYGGTIASDHFVLIPHQPFHDELHKFINQQIVTDAGVIQPKTLYIPTPKSAVYIPFGSNQMAKEVTHFKLFGGQE